MYERTLKEQFISTFLIIYLYFTSAQTISANLPVSKTAFIHQL